MKLPFVRGIEIINKATSEKTDGYIWDQWIALLPNMTKESFVPFEKFKSDLLKTSKPPKEQTDAEIFATIKLLNAAFGGKVVEV